MNIAVGRRAGLIVFAALAAFGCRDASDDNGLACRAYLGSFGVEVTAPEGAQIDAVTVRKPSYESCRSADDQEDAGAVHAYVCNEQDVGVYTIQVTSGDRVWTKTVSLTGDACHLDKGQTVDIVLDPATAD